MCYLTVCKISVSLSFFFFKWIKNEMICCYDRIKTIYHFIKPFLVKTSFFEEPLKLNFYPAVHDNPYFANSADPDQMASSEAI